MHGCAGEDACVKRPERGSEFRALRFLLRRRQHQRALAAETFDLGFGRAQRPAAEQDAARQIFKGERTDHARVFLNGIIDVEAPGPLVATSR
jgi:hypothetical protein